MKWNKTIIHVSIIYRGSRPDVFCFKGVLRNFTKFTGKYLCQNIFFNIIAGLRPVTLLKKRLWHRCFPENFVKFLRTPFFIENLQWLLLSLRLVQGEILLFRKYITSSSKLTDRFRKHSEQ